MIEHPYDAYQRKREELFYEFIYKRDSGEPMPEDVYQQKLDDLLDEYRSPPCELCGGRHWLGDPKCSKYRLRDQAVPILYEHGWSAEKIAAMFGSAVSTIKRILPRDPEPEHWLDHVGMINFRYAGYKRVKQAIHILNIQSREELIKRLDEIPRLPNFGPLTVKKIKAELAKTKTYHLYKQWDRKRDGPWSDDD